MNNSKDPTTFPPISVSIMKSLEDAFPQQDFNPSKTIRELDFHYGQRSVVNFLKYIYEIQNENILMKE